MYEYKFEKIKNLSGFTLIEALTMLFIFSLITITFYQVIVLGDNYIIDAKNRLTALSIANQKMETIRNLKYGDIGTIEGEISGNIPQDEDIIEGGRPYHVDNLVEYEDDPLDGLYPSDTAFEDYKKFTTTVSWDNGTKKENVKLVSRFVPAGLEVLNPGDGILFVNVFSDPPDAQPISGSLIHVVNPDTGLNEEKTTGSDGSVMFMGNTIKDSVQKYQITVSKSGYETVSTLPSYPTFPDYLPKFVNGTVITGSGIPNSVNISQNRLANLKVDTVDYLDQPIANIGFHINGGKLIGNAATADNSPIFNLNTDSSTGSNGEKDFGAISPSSNGGSYSINILPSVTQYETISTDPVSPFVLLPGQDTTFKLKLASKTTTSLLVKVVKTIEGEITPVANANVKLSNNSGSGYDVTQKTAADGTVYFPNTSDVFHSGTYDLKITANGFQDNNSQVTINNNELMVDTVELISQ